MSGDLSPVADVARLVRRRRFGTPELRCAIQVAWFLEPGALRRRFGTKLLRELMWACRHPHPIARPTPVYRGREPDTSLASWSLDPGVACWFAGGYLLRGIVHPADVLFFIDEHEQELIPLSVHRIERLPGNRWVRRLAERHHEALMRNGGAP